jgi:hypothetical protein
MGDDDMSAALKLFADLGITYVPPNQQRRRGPMETNCLGIVDRMIRKFGLPHATITLRTVVESKGNESALIADIVDGVSDLILAHPRWANLGLPFIEAFDQVDLMAIRKIAKATAVQPLRAAIMTLVCVELEKILGPSRLPKPPKQPRIKSDPKPPLSLTRVPGVEKNIALGLELLALRSSIKGNCAFGRQVRRRFDIDGQHACEVMKVARAYGTWPEIFTRLSWNALLMLASPTMPSAVRQELEARILAGESISGPDIVSAREGRFTTTGRPKRRSSTSNAYRMSAFGG